MSYEDEDRTHSENLLHLIADELRMIRFLLRHPDRSKSDLSAIEEKFGGGLDDFRADLGLE
jgi:hypothetical protein